MKRVLLVDDSPMVLAMLSDALSGSYDVVTASSGEEAVRILEGGSMEECGTEMNHFNVIVTDLRMPGMSGLDVAGHVKKMNRSTRFTPVLLLTGEEITKEEARAHGCASYVSKENSGRVVSMINVLLGGGEKKTSLN
jgi:putative two-component system response regulator